MWITNFLANSVTEVNSSDGSLVRVLSGGSYGFDHPSGVAFDGTNMWVSNVVGNSVTKFPAG